MKLMYRGTGTIVIEGVGEVSAGGTIDVPELTGRALVAEQPQHFTEASAPARSSKNRGGD